MPRKRSKENQALPLRWRHVHGAYYYQVPPGLEAQWDNKKTFRLGSKLSEAYKVWADRLGHLEHARSLLAHADSRTTDKIYRRKAERVSPLR